MKLNDNYELSRKERQWIVTLNGETTGITFDAMSFEDTTEVLWDLLKERNVTKSDMLDALINRFDISTVLALGNIDVFVRTLKENGIIEE